MAFKSGGVAYGNAYCIQRRCQARGLEFTIQDIGAFVVEDDDAGASASNAAQMVPVEVAVPSVSVSAVSGLVQRQWLRDAADGRAQTQELPAELIEIDDDDDFVGKANQRAPQLQRRQSRPLHSSQNHALVSFQALVGEGGAGNSGSQSLEHDSHDSQAGSSSWRSRVVGAGNERRVEKLSNALMRKDKVIRQLRSKLRAAKRRAQPKSGLKATRLEQALAKRQQDMSTSKGNTFEMVKAGRMLDGRRGRLTPASIYAVGIRRALSM